VKRMARIEVLRAFGEGQPKLAKPFATGAPLPNG